MDEVRLRLKGPVITHAGMRKVALLSIAFHAFQIVLVYTQSQRVSRNAFELIGAIPTNPLQLI
jgi:hypothetical protein